jgi:AmiR/NasT family two-component response regulator
MARSGITEADAYLNLRLPAAETGATLLSAASMVLTQDLAPPTAD